MLLFRGMQTTDAGTNEGADFVPILASAGNSPDDISLDAYDWALLCKVNGERNITELADECGLTVVEAGLVVLGLIDAGLVQIVGMDSPVFGLGLASGAPRPACPRCCWRRR